MRRRRNGWSPSPLVSSSSGRLGWEGQQHHRTWSVLERLNPFPVLTPFLYKAPAESELVSGSHAGTFTHTFPPSGDRVEFQEQAGWPGPS